MINSELHSRVSGVEEGLRLLREYLPTQPLIRRVYIFGSVCRGEETSNSDIDIAVVSDNATELLMQADWWLRLSLTCPVSVDYTVRNEEDTYTWETMNDWAKKVLFYER